MTNKELIDKLWSLEHGAEAQLDEVPYLYVLLELAKEFLLDHKQVLWDEFSNESAPLDKLIELINKRIS